jgi:hypothetical protein
LRGGGDPGVAHRRDLLVGQCPQEAQFTEHFHVLFVMQRDLTVPQSLLVRADEVIESAVNK